jgi:hypothetical protein
MAKACLPAGNDAQQGMLTVDRTQCLFGDGTRIVFEAPLPNDTQQLERLAFTIEQGTLACARFVDTFSNRMELTAGGKTVVSELHSGGEFHLHCDPGPDYEAAFDLLFTCPGGTAPTDGHLGQLHAGLGEHSRPALHVQRAVTTRFWR